MYKYIFVALLSFHIVKWIYVFFVTAAKRHRQSLSRDRNHAAIMLFILQSTIFIVVVFIM